MQPNGAKKNKLAQAIFSKEGPNRSNPEVTKRPRVTPKIYKVIKRNINGKPIEFSSSAEHVGVVRSTEGNLPSIFARITAHKKALGAVIHTGMARNHRENPTASLRIERLYGIPVLLSGLCSLVFSGKDEDIVDQHHKETVSNLQSCEKPLEQVLEHLFLPFIFFNL